MAAAGNKGTKGAEGKGEKHMMTPVPFEDSSVEQAAALMTAFAERTGLSSAQPARRYLWTDAFAVCNFVALARATGQTQFTELAMRLIDQVHHTLGRFRDDDKRTGWISGLSEREGELHPTRGGLRIGKKLPERSLGQPFDPRLEWDRDGQYFHYLTKWMHALDQVARWTKKPSFNLWARELAEASQTGFVKQASGSHRLHMAWKMSTDLSRPLVGSMGHHDPLDGFITCVELKTTASSLPSSPLGPMLNSAASDFAGLLEGSDFATADPLGIGGLLMDAYWIEQLAKSSAFAFGDLLHTLLNAALVGLAVYVHEGDLREPAARRLAFRELGLAIGLAAFERMRESLPALDGLTRYAELGPAIRSFWSDPEHRQEPSWLEHRDINDVMLATSFLPEGCVVLHAMG
jgi:hypothetical protein